VQRGEQSHDVVIPGPDGPVSTGGGHGHGGGPSARRGGIPAGGGLVGSRTGAPAGGLGGGLTPAPGKGK
jgi:hypothetical protein